LSYDLAPQSRPFCWPPPPPEANEIFIVLPAARSQPLATTGARYYPGPSDRPGERAYRLTAFNANQSVIDQFLSIAREA
jgi:threonine aldolase